MNDDTWTSPHERGLPTFGDDGRDDPPNATPPGADTHVEPEPAPGAPPATYSPISVGPNASAGYGNTHVMYPSWGGGAEPWSGWPVDWTPPWSNQGGMLGKWGTRVDAVFACLDLNSSVMASMPPYLLQGTERLTETRPWMQTPEPLLYPSWAAFMRELVWCYQSIGEVFLYATSTYEDDGRPRRFMLLNPAFVTVDGTLGEETYSLAGAELNRADILHIKYASWPGDLRGHGPLEVAGARLLALDAQMRYSTNLARTGGIPPVVLKHPKRLTRTQMQQMQADWITARASAQGLPAVLNDGTEMDVLASQQAKDIAMSEVQQFNESRIATLLRVPPYLVGLPAGSSGTYANSTNQFDFHWRAGLRPLADLLMGALSGWLLPAGTDIKLDRDEYIRPGLMERSQAYSMLVGAGIMTADEIRAKEHMPPLPDGAGATITTDPAAVQAAQAAGVNGRPTITNTNPAGEAS